MKTPAILLCAAAAAAGPASAPAQGHRSVDQIMPRRQVHLDFHTSEHIPDVGARFDKAQFQEALRSARLTAINIFAKGHHGWSYYPSEVGRIHPSLDFDLLGAELEACREIRVECPFYFTVGWSVRDAELHPEWVVRQKDGSFSASNWDFSAGPDDPRPSFSWKLLCPSGAYHEQIMRQVGEICRRYDVAGFFFDIYQVNRGCWCHNCLARMRRDGVDPNDTGAVIGNFARQYRDHMQALRDLVARHHPEATIFFNGTSTMRRLENLRYRLYEMNTHQDLEDLPTTWGGYDRLPLAAKFYLHRGWPITAMSGKFHTAWGEFGGFKHPDAMRYEAAAMISSGAACNFGDQMHPSGEMDLETYRLIGEAFEYVEQIEGYGPGGVPASRLGLWLTNDEAADRGVSNMLLELHEDFAIADGTNLEDFETVIVPGAPSLTDEGARDLNAYVAGGGKLLVLGRGALNQDGSGLALDLGVRYVGPARYVNDYTVVEDALGEDLVSSPFLNFEAAVRVEPEAGTEVLAAIREPYFDRTYTTYSSHQNTPFRLEDAPHPAVTRKGGVVFLAHTLGRQYFEHGLRLHRQLFHNALRLVYEEPMLEVELPSAGRINLLHQPRQRRYVVHLLYASPITRGRVTVIEDLPTLHDIPVAVRLPEKVRRVSLVPGGQRLAFTRRGGVLRVVVPELTMHRAVVFEY